MPDLSFSILTKQNEVNDEPLVNVSFIKKFSDNFKTKDPITGIIPLKVNMDQRLNLANQKHISNLTTTKNTHMKLAMHHVTCAELLVSELRMLQYALKTFVP